MSYTSDQLNILKKEMPEIKINNFSVTTSSIYLKTPDGYSLRIGDHNGKVKYKYKWNLLQGSKTEWIRDGAYTRFYTDSVYEIIKAIKENL